MCHEEKDATQTTEVSIGHYRKTHLCMSHGAYCKENTSIMFMDFSLKSNKFCQRCVPQDTPGTKEECTYANKKPPSSLKRQSRTTLQSTLFPVLVRVQPTQQGSTRAIARAPGRSQASWAGLSTAPHSNLHLPLAPQDPVLRTMARFSAFDQVLGKLSFRSPFPTSFTPTALTWGHSVATTGEDDSFQSTTRAWPHPYVLCEKRHKGASGRGEEALSRQVPSTRCSRAPPERLRTAPMYFRVKALSLHQKRALLPTRSRDDRHS